MSNVTKKRRTIFIKPGFQIRFITSSIVLLILCCFCSAAVLYPLISGELSSRLTLGHLDIESINNYLVKAILIGNVLAIIVASLAAGVVILYISHKIAGPLFRFEWLCKEIGSGNLNVSARIRKTDQLEGLSEAFGEMLGQLRNRCCDQYTRIETARRDLNALRDALPDPSASREIVESVDNQLTSLAEEMKESTRPEEINSQTPRDFANPPK